MDRKSAFAGVALGCAWILLMSPALAYTKAGDTEGYRKAVVAKPEHRKVAGMQKAVVPDREAVAVENPIRKKTVRRMQHADSSAQEKKPARDR